MKWFFFATNILNINIILFYHVSHKMMAYIDTFGTHTNLPIICFKNGSLIIFVKKLLVSGLQKLLPVTYAHTPLFASIQIFLHNCPLYCSM